jgi:hypothetical protein
VDVPTNHSPPFVIISLIESKSLASTLSSNQSSSGFIRILYWRDFIYNLHVKLTPFIDDDL